MKPADDHEADAPRFSAADGSPFRGPAADVIGTGDCPPRWPGQGARRPTAAVAAAALVAGLLLGYLGGRLEARPAGSPAAPASAARAAAPTGAPQAASPALTETGNLCAVQHGKTLQLGIEIANQSGGGVTVRRISPVLPLGALRPMASAWGTCGALPGPPGYFATPTLHAGATGWLTVTFDVMVQCPAPDPVLFKVSYVRSQSGRAATTELPGFADLGQVPYTGCPLDH